MARRRGPQDYPAAAAAAVTVASTMMPLLSLVAQRLDVDVVDHQLGQPAACSVAEATWRSPPPVPCLLERPRRSLLVQAPLLPQSQPVRRSVTAVVYAHVG